MMKNILYTLTAIVLMIGLYLLSAPQGYAQEETPPGTPEPAAAPPEPPAEVITETQEVSTAATSGSTIETTVTLGQLGFVERTVEGPYDSAEFSFGLPASWNLVEGGEVSLDLLPYYHQLKAEAGQSISSTVRGGTLTVSFNDVTLQTLPIDQVEEYSVNLPIPAAALTSTRSDGRHELKVSLDSATSCDVNLQTNVVIRPASRLTLPYEISPIPIDLRLLPRPFYQASFEPDTGVIVVPEQPTAGELKAALAVAAGFGRMTGGALALSLKPVDELTSADRDSQHLILVGKARALPLLRDIPGLPAPVNGPAFRAADMSPGDGVIQMAVSPWNETRGVLVVSGDSDEAVVKAGQALSTGVVRVGEQPNLALVAEVQADTAPAAAGAVDRTFTQLGYGPEKAENSGASNIRYTFYVPAGYVPVDDPYLDLLFNHSALLDYEDSGLVVTLNDEPVGSIRFSQESTQLTRERLVLPRFAFHPGRNELVIRTELEPYSRCSDPDLEGLWLTVWPDSSLHLPLNPVDGPVRQAFDLTRYPEPYTFDPTLKSTAFVLAPQDPVAWNVAAQIATDLGRRVNIPVAEFEVIIDEAVPEEIRQEQHLVIIGRPSSLPIIGELGDVLPAPFQAGSDTAIERNMRVLYRIPEGTQVGYLEAIAAPWNSSRAVLAVLGNSDEGLQEAGMALVDWNLRSKLSGNFAVINEQQIASSDFAPERDEEDEVAALLGGGGANSEPAGQEEPGGTGGTTPAAEDDLRLAAASPPAAGGIEVPWLGRTIAIGSGQPPWVLSLLAGSTVLMVVIIALALVSSFRQQRSAR